MTNLEDRYIATLWGLHVGDAIWAPYETKPASCIPALLGPNGLRFHTYENPWPKDRNGKQLPAGRPTDDSDQAADLCYSLLECNGVDQEHLHQALHSSVIHGKSRLWNGHATGAGRTTRAMLGDDTELRANMIAQPFASNGSLMRSAPMALWLGPTPQGYPAPHSTDYHQVKAMSEVTHIHPDSGSACWLYVRIVRNALTSRDIMDVEQVNTFDQRIIEYSHEVQECGERPADPGSFANGWGGAEYTLKVALHAVMTTTSFEDCIRTVGLAGGDTDTYGAVAGALAGALYGTAAIPRSWRNTILGKKPLQAYAEHLYTAHLRSMV